MNLNPEAAPSPRPQLTIDLREFEERLGPRVDRWLADSRLVWENRPVEGELVTIDVEACTELAEAGLTEVATDTAQDMKQEYVADIRSDYPDDFDDDDQIITPRKYAKKHGLNGTQRARLKPVYDKHVQESRTNLTAELVAETEDRDWKELVASYDIQNGVVHFARSIQQVIDELVEKLDELLPQESVRLFTKKWFKSIVTAPELVEADYDPAIKPLVNKLGSWMWNVRTQGQKLVAVNCIRYYSPYITGGVVEELQAQYEALTTKHIGRLASILEPAYEQLAPHQIVHVTPRRLTEAVNTPIQDEASGQPEQLVNAPAEEVLGEIESPFPWLDASNPVEVSLVRSGNKALLVATAMTPVLKDISERVRAEESGNKLDSFVARIKEIEVSGNPQGHNMVRRVRGVDFHGHTVRYLANVRANPIRVYYVRTNLKRYEEVYQLPQARGLPSDTPFVVIIGETDKANQLRLYGEFGVKRRIARTRGAGSV